MECPHCKYDDTDDNPEKTCGDFWKMSNDVKMNRQERPWREIEEAHIIGCPSCSKIFLYEY